MVNPNAAYDKFKDKHVTTKGLGKLVVDDDVFYHNFLLKGAL